MKNVNVDMDFLGLYKLNNMNKYLIQNDDLLDVLTQCYASDPTFIKKYHELAGKSLATCIDRTYNDFIEHNVNSFVLVHENSVVGFFGEYVLSNEYWLTGFFVKPEHRTPELKKDVWNTIKEHFNDEFKVGMLSKNVPAKRFLQKNGCKFSHNEIYPDGLVEMFVYVKGTI